LLRIEEQWDSGEKQRRNDGFTDHLIDTSLMN